MTKFIIIQVLLAALIFISLKNVAGLNFVAQSATEGSSSVGASVKVSVCGDGIVEGRDEDCEGEDLNGQTCETQGYSGGDLSCDIACSFVYTECLAPTPTPTPSPTPTPQSTPTPTPTSTPASTATPAPTDSPSSSTSTITQLIEDAVALVTSTIDSIIPSQEKQEETIAFQPMPASVQVFDFDGNGNIDQYEIREAVQNWVDDWQLIMDLKSGPGFNKSSADYLEKISLAKCDLNHDNDCGLQDFSILMYYAR